MATTTTLEGFEEVGVAALVRAGEAKNWFAGHFGAAMIAGVRLLRQPDLNGSAGLALHKKLDEMRTSSSYSHWFSPLDDPGEVLVGVEPVLSVLRNSAHTLRMSGHPTIYMSAALWVLAHRPELATDRIMQALVRLHDAARLDDPARHYGCDDYYAEIENEPPSPEADEAPCDGVARMRRAFDALNHLVPDQSIDGRHYFLTGERIHVVTHAHAISTFEELGYMDLAAFASRAQRSLLRLTSRSRLIQAPAVEPVAETPLDAAFWQKDVRDPFHVIKLAEAVVAELPRLPAAERSLAWVRLGRMWALLGVD